MRNRIKWILVFLLITAILGSLFFCFYCYYFAGIGSDAEEDVYVGVAFGLNTTSEAKLLIDKVKEYTNLFVIQSWPVSVNETAMNEICDYVVDAGMRFIVFFDFISHIIYPWHIPWLDNAMERWGDKFLGVYLYDEPGGHQLDTGSWRSGVEVARNASDYSDASNQFIADIYYSRSMQDLKNRSIPVFTSDYALYWFDFLAGYDTVFAEFGWNHSRLQHIALCRGAARMQNKQWGVIVTWTYRSPPYLESGKKLFEDMMTAYHAGAKYILVFGYPRINPYGILDREHFDALRSFWDWIHKYPRSNQRTKDGEVAFVLPKDYGWGMRSLEDNIWGLWSADDLSPQIWGEMNRLIGFYGSKLDIIYEDFRDDERQKYSTVHFWNDTVLR